MDNIIYCEDDKIRREAISGLIKSFFPNYSLIAEPSVRYALGKFSGIDFKGMKNISIDSLTAALKDGNVNADTLRIVLTDGRLHDYEATTSDKRLDGWDLAEVLKNIGYQGSIIYVGGSKLEKNKADFFTKKIEKYDPDFTTHLVDYLNSAIKEKAMLSRR